MPKRISEMSALAASRLATPGLHFVGGVSGLARQVLPKGGRSWILRLHIDGKRREMGLGAFPDITLAQARDKARAKRELLDLGIDPIEQRLEQRRVNSAAKAANMLFEDAAWA